MFIELWFQLSYFIFQQKTSANDGPLYELQLEAKSGSVDVSKLNDN